MRVKFNKLHHFKPDITISDYRTGVDYALYECSPVELLDLADYEQGTGAFGQLDPGCHPIDFLMNYFTQAEIDRSLIHDTIEFPLDFDANEHWRRKEMAQYFGLTMPIPGLTSL